MAVFTTIDNPSAYFKVQLWTGNATNRSITFDDTDTDMQPDAIWIKDRDGVNWQDLTDSVRGATKSLYPSETDAEGTIADAVTAFGSDGFSLGTNAQVNGNTVKYVAWCWKESADAGMDIVTYTGNATDDTDISHSLSAVPHVIIIKNRDQGSGYNWRVYHHKNTSAPETDRLNLNDTNGTHDDASYWSDEAPTSSVFTLGTDSSLNGNTHAHVAYLWSEKQGFSKFGSYTGNGTINDNGGTYVYTGFRPAFLLVKRSNSTGNWMLIDNKRIGFNDENRDFKINNNDAERDVDQADLLSNGFKVRTTSTDWNTSGGLYIYMAFAEASFVNSKGVPCNAR